MSAKERVRLDAMHRVERNKVTVVAAALMGVAIRQVAADYGMGIDILADSNCSLVSAGKALTATISLMLLVQFTFQLKAIFSPTCKEPASTDAAS